MQSFYPETFERDMASSDAEWRAALTRAVGAHPLHWRGNEAEVQIGSGRLRIGWSPLPERRIALLVMQRLCVRFAFEGLSEQERYAFMRPFDLTMQRGGG
jgi:hypothetical protein